jgi:hypothetical protein
LSGMRASSMGHDLYLDVSASRGRLVLARAVV